MGVGVQLAERLLAWRCDWSVVTWGDGQSAALVLCVVFFKAMEGVSNLDFGLMFPVFVQPL